MSVSATVKDGQLVTGTTTTAAEKAAAKSSSSVDKTDFMNLLVAQMKYQDPLEPTSNTEWVSQYSTFTELEQMQNMSNSITLQRASGLVGKEVIIDHTDSSTGKETTVQGKVDYVTYVSDQAYLSVINNLYSIDEVQSVVDDAYSTAVSAAEAIETEFAKLPALADLTISDKESVSNINTVYSNLSDYQKGFLTSGFSDKLQQYVDKMSQLTSTTTA